jgi:hypothetical protein
VDDMLSVPIKDAELNVEERHIISMDDISFLSVVGHVSTMALRLLAMSMHKFLIRSFVSGAVTPHS